MYIFLGGKMDFLYISKDTYFRNVTWKFYRKIPKIFDTSLV